MKFKNWFSTIIVAGANVLAIMDLAHDAKTEVSDYTLLVLLGSYILSGIRECRTNRDYGTTRNVIMAGSVASGFAVLGHLSTGSQAIITSISGLFVGGVACCSEHKKQSDDSETLLNVEEFRTNTNYGAGSGSGGSKV
jgi:hypothetical protein